MDIPAEFMEHAYTSQQGEPAWKRSDAEKVIQWATQSGIAIFGVEVWLPTSPGPTIPTPFFYTSSCDPRENEGWNDFVERANSEALVYIQSFEWDAYDVRHHDMRYNRILWTALS